MTEYTRVSFVYESTTSNPEHDRSIIYTSDHTTPYEHIDFDQLPDDLDTAIMCANIVLRNLESIKRRWESICELCGWQNGEVEE